MELTKTFIILSILAISSIFYKGYENKQKLAELSNNSDLIQKYFFNEKSKIKTDKPIIWIHLTHEVNPRWWENFYSRNSTYINQSYIYLTISSIINQSGNDFNIYIIDDSSFKSLLPTLKINVLSQADPIRTHFRKLCMSRVLYKYGGMFVPNSFLCLNSLYTIYDEGIRKKGMFICESINTTNPYSTKLFSVNSSFMGCNKDNAIMLDYINMLEYLISTDYTNTMDFRDSINNWCSSRIISNNINIISGKKIGIKTTNNTPMLVEDLLGSSIINIAKFAHGILIPSDTILKRTKYEWFLRMSIGQILKSHLYD